MKKAWVLSYLLSAQRRLWSDWADAQAYQSLRWAHTHFLGFVTRWLNFGTYHPQHDKTKKTACAPSKDSWSVPAFAQPDQGLRCVHKNSSGPLPSLEYTAKTDQTANTQADLTESLMGTHILLALSCSGSYILNQSYNETQKWLNFCMNMWWRTIYLRYIAQVLTKNLWCTVSNISTARLSEL